MHFDDSTDSTFPSLPSGSRLLSESPLPPSSSGPAQADLQTGPGGADLSLSELSLSERSPPADVSAKPFSLLARPRVEPPSTTPPISGEEEEPVARDGYSDEEFDEGDIAVDQAHIRRTREEKLQSDLFVLKKLNGAFSAFGDALGRAESANDRVAAQLAQTDALLNQYIDILSKSEDVARLIFDEDWFGAEADEITIEAEQKAAAEAMRLAAEQRARIEHEEQARREREEQERVQREAREEQERSRQERLMARGGVRGVRGTRASMMRGTRASATSGSGRGTGVATSRHGSSAAVRGRPETAVSNSSGEGVGRGMRSRGGTGTSGLPTRGSGRRS